MLKILGEKVLKTDTEIRGLYKNCKYVYTIDLDNFIFYII